MSVAASRRGPKRRPLIPVGDCVFQMTGTGLGTPARLELHPIVVVFDNRGHAAERLILDGPFNDIGASPITWASG